MKFYLKNIVLAILIFSVHSQINTVKLIKNQISISWKHSEHLTNFLITNSINFDKHLKEVWLAIGFNNKADMANASVVLCRYSKVSLVGTVQHYLNTNAYNSFPLDMNNLTIGIENIYVKTINNKFICSFDRRNDIVKSGYFRIDTNNNIYILAAFGSGKLLINKIIAVFIYNFF